MRRLGICLLLLAPLAPLAGCGLEAPPLRPEPAADEAVSAPRPAATVQEREDLDERI
ncbi:MAG: hypothetical protein KDA50_01360 [Rhodobacteraceae bacterium]|nr:hypothetical protein [Paracoccaceae bacterium]